MLWVGNLIGNGQESPCTGTMPERGEVVCRLLETVQRCLDMAVLFLNTLCFLYQESVKFPGDFMTDHDLTIPGRIESP